jgi:hypothetical protein
MNGSIVVAPVGVAFNPELPPGLNDPRRDPDVATRGRTAVAAGAAIVGGLAVYCVDPEVTPPSLLLLFARRVVDRWSNFPAAEATAMPVANDVSAAVDFLATPLAPLPADRLELVCGCILDRPSGVDRRGVCHVALALYSPASR